MNRFFMFIIVIFLIILTACQGKEPTQAMLESPTAGDTNPTENTGYPVTGDRPTPTDSGYPINEPTTSEYPLGPDFSIDQPAVGGDTVVTGNGPAGVPIILINVSEVGTILGETVIESDGTFTMELETPLKSNHTIGLQVGDLEGTEFNPEEFLYQESHL